MCPKSHLIAAQQFMSRCSKFLIIGTSGLDEDLRAILDNAVPPDSSPFVHVVNRGEADANDSVSLSHQVTKAWIVT